jgi:hypothetical protein
MRSMFVLQWLSGAQTKKSTMIKEFPSNTTHCLRPRLAVNTFTSAKKYGAD